MSSEASPIIVATGQTANTSQVNHRDFPEIRAEGESPQAAARQLSNQLTKALDTALTKWRREAIEKAIAEVKAFAESGA